MMLKRGEKTEGKIESNIILKFKGGQAMRATGTNELMDIWWKIQTMKQVLPRPLSKRAKNRLTVMYVYYKYLGGERVDKDIEDWKKEDN